jgi:putative transposase
VKRNVKRWRGGLMVLRWTAAAVLEAVKGFRRLKGHADMPSYSVLVISNSGSPV